MAKPSQQYQPPTPGPHRLRESVRSALYSLRHFTEVCLHTWNPLQTLPPAELDVALVASVEGALKCCLPDEALACIANRDSRSVDDGFVLGEIVDNTHLAWKRGCPKDLVAVGRHPDSHAFYCVPRSGPRDRGVQIVERDNLDGSLNWYDLGEWLAQMVEWRQEFLSEGHPSLIEWKPSQTELAGFLPSLVE